MKLPSNIKIYGDVDFRGNCPSENAEMITFFNAIRKTPLGAIATHIRNEGKRSFNQAMRHKAEGMNTGAADIIIPGGISFVCELKRTDHTKSKITEDQINYLTAAKKAGAFVCIALGHKAALEAINDYIKELSKRSS